MNVLDYHEKILKLSKESQDFVVVTLIDTKGSAPQDVGARAIFCENKLCFGTVGGGKVEKHCLDFSLALLEKKEGPRCTLKSWNLQKDIGMTCGGVVSFYFEVFRPSDLWNIVVFGAGHVSQELCRVLLQLNCKLTCVDQREEWLLKLPKNEKLTIRQEKDPASYLHKIPPHSFVVCMTQGHKTDKPILELALKEFNFPYLGAIGSLAKSMVLKKELRESGLDESRAEDFICPIGESIGDNSPCEIAISIAAQLLKYKDQYFKTTKRLS